eukprot:2419284-Ditylum_brightwellii.AAC.1
MTKVTESEQPSSEPSEQLTSKKEDKPTEQERPKAHMMWTNKGNMSKNTQLTSAINKMLMTIKQLEQQIIPSTIPTEEHTKPRELLHRETPKVRRKRNQRGINEPPAVPISYPTHHNNTHQNGPNIGSKREVCPATEHGRSEVGPVPNETPNTDEPPKMNEPNINKMIR